MIPGAPYAPGKAETSCRLARCLAACAARLLIPPVQIDSIGHIGVRPGAQLSIRLALVIGGDVSRHQLIHCAPYVRRALLRCTHYELSLVDIVRYECKVIRCNEPPTLCG